MLAAGLVARDMAPGFALGGAVRDASLLWSATISLAPPEGEPVKMPGTLWALLLPALLGLLNRQPAPLARALAVAAAAPAML